MNKLSILAVSSALFFVACGSDSGTNGTNPSAEADYSVDTYAMLPKCDEKKEGQTGYVTGTSKLYVCEDGEWVVTQKPSSPSSSASEEKPGDGPSTGFLTDDRDGQKYKTTKIDEQVWMAENLNYAYLQPTAELDSSSFCYDNDPAMCKKYGRLYLWSAAMDSAGVLKNDGKGKGCGEEVECGVQGPIQGICPKGWHLPSKDEFDKLLAFVGDDADDKLRAESGWSDGRNGMDLYGFSALPAGYYNGYGKRFYDLGYDAYFWSSTEYDSYGAYYLYLYDGRAGVGGSGKDNGRSVRCLQDN